ncbi:3-hydroxyacyl-[acyl-carrier-protein] dehydratase FabZ, partial [Lactiplantibacillus plantarum]
MTTLDTSTIQTLIPNRYPLFYIDRVTELVPDESIVAEKYVS